MCTLAHVFEAAGLSTVVFSSIRSVAERTHPPRALHCEFPLGRPVGNPLDPEHQHKVLAAGLALLERDQGPVLEDFPETILAADAEPLACALPPRYDATLPAAVDEAQALRDAWNRAYAASGRTSMGRAIGADEVPDALATLTKVAEGEDWQAVGLPGPPKLMQIAHDIRTYYAELSTELADGPPGAWAAERWFYDRTEAGKVLLEARRKLKAAKVPQPMWFYMAVGSES